MRQSIQGLLSFAVLIGTAAGAFADVYTDGTVTADFTRQGADVVGTISLGVQKFPARATGAGDALNGSFHANDTDFNFTAKLQNDTLTLTTGGRTYTLKSKSAAPVNPLGEGAAAPAAAGTTPAAAGTLPAGYTVVTHTDAGQAWSANKPDATSVRAALLGALPDLAHYFDDKPQVGGAYEDNKDHRTGGAIFTSTLKGQPVRGMISAKLTDKGADVAIVYARADATPEDWKKLTAAPPAAGGAIDFNLKEFQFPDGTGSVGIADGWSTKAQSGLGTVSIDGPNDEHVVIGANFSIMTPDSQFLQTQRQLEQQARRMGMAPPPAPPMLIASFAGPADALKVLVPQIDQISRRNGGYGMRLDQIVSEQSIAGNSPNSKAAILEYYMTKDDHGTITQHHNIGRMECTPIGPGSWSLWAIEITAPKDSFDKEKPVMLAMVQSFKENAQVMQQITQQRIQAQQQQFQAGQDAHNAQEARFQAQQEAHRQQMAGYEAHNQQWARDENTKARSNDNFVETIRGYRTVIDTQTGEKSSVDYNNVDGIVNGLNQNVNDPNRFVQIPLRDENDPIPAGR